MERDDFIGRIFGPVMLVWFLMIAILGLGGIALAPGVLAAANPIYAVGFVLHTHLKVSFAVLGAVFLAVTGGEAMYADMGHFGRFRSASPGLHCAAWAGAQLLRSERALITDPSVLENPFYELAPGWAHYALIVLATMAAIIASQAIISGTFSLTQQAIQLGFLPRVSIRHTASHERGQIYVPLVNWLLGAFTTGAVIGFGSSEALAGAYGIAVSLLMVITTVLAGLVALQWGFNPLAVLAVNGFFLVIDLIFFSANVLKLFEGGWFPLLLAGSVAFLMLTWRTGQRLVERAKRRLRQPEEVFLRNLQENPPVRVPGTAAFLTPAMSGMPVALVHHLKHNRVLHERLLLVSVVTLEEPRVEDAERVEVVPISEAMSRVVLRFGFMETPDVKQGLKLAIAQGRLMDVNPSELTYYLGRETILPTDRPGMAQWREVLFSILHRNAERSAAYFCVPARQVVEIGVELEI